MQQHLVVWGEIGTERKALFTIELLEEESKVVFHAFPKEIATKEVQDQLFKVWKNGGAFEFPDDCLEWVVDSNAVDILPKEITLDKPHLLVNAQRQWQKRVMLKRNFTLYKEKTSILKLEIDALKKFDNAFWNKTKALWSEIIEQKNKGLLDGQNVNTLKLEIDEVFTGLKAFRRLDSEQNFDESKALLALHKKEIAASYEKMVYPEEWNGVFQNLKKIQSDINKGNLIFKHKRQLYKLLDDAFNKLRSYRQADHVKFLNDKLKGLEKALYGNERGIKEEEENYTLQIEKMKHYTKGKMTDAEIEEQFRPLLEKINAKKKKVKNIKKAIQKLAIQIEKAKEPKKKKATKNKKTTKKKQNKPLKVEKQKSNFKENDKKEVS